MIKERPSSMYKVVLAFAGTGAVAMLPVVLLALTHPELRRALGEAVTGYGGTVVITAAAICAVAATSWFLAAVVRRKPRALRA